MDSPSQSPLHSAMAAWLAARVHFVDRVAGVLDVPGGSSALLGLGAADTLRSLTVDSDSSNSTGLSLQTAVGMCLARLSELGADLEPTQSSLEATSTALRRLASSRLTFANSLYIASMFPASDADKVGVLPSIQMLLNDGDDQVKRLARGALEVLAGVRIEDVQLTGLGVNMEGVEIQHGNGAAPSEQIAAEEDEIELLRSSQRDLLRQAQRMEDLRDRDDRDNGPDLTYGTETSRRRRSEVVSAATSPTHGQIRPVTIHEAKDPNHTAAELSIHQPIAPEPAAPAPTFTFGQQVQQPVRVLVPQIPMQLVQTQQPIVIRGVMQNVGGQQVLVPSGQQVVLPSGQQVMLPNGHQQLVVGQLGQNGQLVLGQNGQFIVGQNSTQLQQVVLANGQQIMVGQQPMLIQQNVSGQTPVLIQQTPSTPVLIQQNVNAMPLPVQVPVGYQIITSPLSTTNVPMSPPTMSAIPQKLLVNTPLLSPQLEHPAERPATASPRPAAPPAKNDGFVAPAPKMKTKAFHTRSLSAPVPPKTLVQLQPGPVGSPKGSPGRDNKEKRCEGCGTNESPEWRRGPGGVKSLCNACGLRFSRRRKLEARLRMQEEEPEPVESFEEPAVPILFSARHDRTASIDTDREWRASMVSTDSTQRYSGDYEFIHVKQEMERTADEETVDMMWEDGAGGSGGLSRRVTIT